MLALGHQFVFKALRSLDCCSDAAHTYTHTRTQMLTEGSVHTKMCLHHSDDSYAAAVEYCLYCLGWSAWQTVMKWMTDDIPSYCSASTDSESLSAGSEGVKFITNKFIKLERSVFGTSAVFEPFRCFSKRSTFAQVHCCVVPLTAPDTCSFHFTQSCFVLFRLLFLAPMIQLLDILL